MMTKIRARAPLRLSFGGGGTEISPYIDEFGGRVLNATIDLHSYAILENTSATIEFRATDLNISIVADLDDQMSPIDSALPIHCAVYCRIVDDYCGGKRIPISLTTFTDAPVGSGLGSSSTLTVSIIKAFDEYLGLTLGEYEVAHLAYLIERHDLNLSGGMQDQYTASFGGFNFMEFDGGDRVLVNPLRVRNWIVSELELSLLLYYTGASRQSANIIVDQRSRMEEQDKETLENLHLIREYAYEMKTHLLKGDLPAFADVINKSWAAKKGTSNKVSNSAIDTLYEAALSAGAIGGKISGAGGGGFMMLLCDPSNRMRLSHMLEKQPGKIFACRFTSLGAESWKV